MHVEPGSVLKVRSATGELLERRATSGVERGFDFPIVWVCREEEWTAARAEGREPARVPWPAEDVVSNGADPT